jgi:hypothetical protein
MIKRHSRNIAAFLLIISSSVITNAAPRPADKLAVNSEPDARRILAHFITREGLFPGNTTFLGGSVTKGVYRLEVDSQRKVVAITVLKNVNRDIDLRAMKSLVTWRAKQGPSRVVDVSLILPRQRRIFSGGH